MLLALEKSKPGFGQQESGNVPAKCSNVDMLLREGKKLLCACWTLLKPFRAVKVFDYAAGKKKQYVLFSKFK